jgi:hypothetical protein
MFSPAELPISAQSSIMASMIRMLQPMIDAWAVRQGLGAGDAGLTEWVDSVERNTQVFEGMDTTPLGEPNITPLEELLPSAAQACCVASRQTHFPIPATKLAELLEHGRILEERLGNGPRTGESVATLQSRMQFAVERLEERLFRLFLVAKWTLESLRSDRAGPRFANQGDIGRLVEYLTRESEEYKARAAEEILLSKDT